MTRLLFILLFFTGTFLSASGQAGTLSKNKRWAALQLQYDSIPIGRLKTIEKELDSTIAADDCYKFIHNADTTKFLAFFIQRKDDPSYSRVTHFGRVVHIHNQPSQNDSINYYGYVLWGMKF